jgi:glycosyltransferase involved in cell wall biosynthesis
MQPKEGTAHHDNPEVSKQAMQLTAQRETLPPMLDPTLVIPTTVHAGRPLRICMVAYTFYESDNRVMRYAETLAREGHHVEVFALQPGRLPVEENLCGVDVYRLQSRLVNEKTRFSYLWRILSFLARSFYRVSANDLKQRYDLVHVHSVPDFLVFSALVPRLRGTPVILDIHDILPEFYCGKFGVSKDSMIFRVLCWTERLCSKFASHVIIANHLWRERLLSRSVTDEKCSVVMNSPDRAIFSSSEGPLPKRDRFILLYPGTLNWHQGLDIAIRAFAKISAQVPYADFHIYGEGPSKEPLLVLIRDLGLQGRVVMHEMKKLREIPAVIENSDLGVVPKRKENFGNEAFSTKILEFMAMKVPVIVSDTRIDRYYFNDSLVRFFEGGNEDDLASCMLDLIQHPEKRRELVANASEFVAKNDWNVKKYEYLDLVQDLTRQAD